MKSLLLGLTVSTTLHAAPLPTPISNENIEFEFQSLLEPYEKMDCSHKKHETRPYDWIVTCTDKKKSLSFDAHIVIGYYPMTSEKLPAYQVLYWVYNRNAQGHSPNSSTTSWYYLNSKQAKLKIMQMSQGIMDDQAYLKLKVTL